MRSTVLPPVDKVGTGDTPVNADKHKDMQMPLRTNFRVHRDCHREIVDLLGCSIEEVLDSSTWIKADACAQQASEKGDFNLAFELLERMAEDPHASTEMNGETVYLVVEQWLEAYGRYHKSSKGTFTQYMYGPITVWRKIESFLQRGIPVSSRTLHRILEATALIRSKKLTGPVLAETILETMLTLGRFQNPEIRPSIYTFNAVMASWEAVAVFPWRQQAAKEAPERCLKLLERAKALYDAGWGEELLPDKISYRRVMNLYAQMGDGEKVEELLEELYESFLIHGHKNQLPTAPLFSLVLFAWSKSNDLMAAERAATILNRMLELERNKELPGFKVTAFCFNIAMVCWSKQRTRKSAIKAQKLYDDMVAMSETDPSKKPIAGSYAAIVQTWSYVDPKRAEDILWTWKREHSLGNCDMRMDPKLFCSLIAGWCGSKYPDSAKRCDKLLQYAIDGNFGGTWEPNLTPFIKTINAYCRTKTAEDVARAEELLTQMKTLAKSGRKFPKPTAASYSPVIKELTRRGQVEKAEMLLYECFDRDDSDFPGEEVDHYRNGDDASNGHRGRHLRVGIINRVLKAWVSKATVLPEAADRAEDLLLKMKEWGVKPNLGSFQFVLACRKRANDEHRQLTQTPDFVSRANQILAFLDKEYEAGDLNADKSSYLSTRRDWALATV